MREQLVKELGSISMAQSIILDLFFIVFHRIMVIEQTYGIYDITISELMPEKPGEKGHADYVQLILDRLYHRLDLLMELFAKVSPDGKRIQIKAASFQVQVDGHNLSGMDRE